MREPFAPGHILQTLPDTDEQTMASLSRVGIAGVLAAVAAAVIYLAVFSGGPGDLGGPAGGGDPAIGEARAERLFAALKESPRFKAAGGSVRWETAEALGDEGVLIRKLSIGGADLDGRPAAVAADEVRVRRIDWNNIGMSPYGDIEIRGLTATNSKVAAFARQPGSRRSSPI